MSDVFFRDRGIPAPDRHLDVGSGSHAEAGLRSFDMTMPEEINRKLTDAISDLLFVTEESGMQNLRAEGVPEERIHLVGNVMIDTLLRNMGRGGTPGRRI